MADRQEPPDWIPLGAASRLLGVDPATLRRWATAGRVESYRTPGGHRRFSRAVVERVRASRTPVGAPAWAAAHPEHVRAAYTRRIRGPSTPFPESWVATLSPSTIAAYRERGRRTIQIMVAILDAPDAGGRAGREAGPSVAALAAAAREEGAETARFGLPLIPALSAVLAARQPFIAELAAHAGRRRLSAVETARLMTRGADLLNHYLIAYVEGFEAALGTARAAGATVDRAPSAPRGAAAGGTNG